jgi:hypothetical protein
MIKYNSAGELVGQAERKQIVSTLYLMRIMPP